MIKTNFRVVTNKTDEMMITCLMKKTKTYDFADAYVDALNSYYDVNGVVLWDIPGDTTHYQECIDALAHVFYAMKK